MNKYWCCYVLLLDVKDASNSNGLKALSPGTAVSSKANPRCQPRVPDRSGRACECNVFCDVMLGHAVRPRARSSCAWFARYSAARNAIAAHRRWRKYPVEKTPLVGARGLRFKFRAAHWNHGKAEVQTKPTKLPSLLFLGGLPPGTRIPPQDSECALL